MAIDITYLKKRAVLIKDATDSFNDDKVQSALAKIVPPALSVSKQPVATGAGYSCVVQNKTFRNWIDLIPPTSRGLTRFTYEDGTDTNVLKYIRPAMTRLAWENFANQIIQKPTDDDLYLMRWLIWHFVVLKKPVGFDFENYEMNMIFDNLPIDISKDKIKFARQLSFAEFYRQIKFAEWGLANVD